MNNNITSNAPWLRRAWFAMTLLMLATAYGDSTASLPLQHFTSVELTQVDSRYSLASLPYSSGFMQVNEKEELEWAPDIPSSTQIPFGLNPDFGQLKRYWLYTRVANLSDSDDWVLHISNFGFNAFKVLVRGDNEQTVKVFDNSIPNPEVDINALGRAVKVTLKPKVEYLIIVELAASHAVWHPYIGLMAEGYYQDWQTKMDFTAKVAIGVVLGMILLAVLCWALLKDVTFFWAAFSSFLLLCYYLEHSSLPAVFLDYNYEKTGFFWFLVSVVFISVLGFAASFLQVGRKGKWYYLFSGSVLITVLIYALSTVATFYINSLLYAFNSVIVWVVILSSGIAKVRSEGRYYLIYILGWLPLVLSILQVIWVINRNQMYSHEISVSYKIIEVIYIHIAHMIIHAIAMILRYKAMRRDKQKFELLSYAKSRFIAQSSHDLRQPLHTMQIFLEHLKPYISNSESHNVYYNIIQIHRQMEDSFNSIMNLNKLEAGVINANLKVFGVNELFINLKKELLIQAQDKNIQLQVVNNSYFAYSDPELLERILRNLITNAIKYTDNGKVVVGCRRRDENILIQVLDTGVGIPEGDQGTIFDIYQRSESNKKSIDGMGIGLSVVKHLADLLSHPIDMKSIPNKGSVFSITVPKVKASGSDNQKKYIRSQLPLIALVCHEVEIINSLQALLHKWQYPTKLFSSLNDVIRHSSNIGILICDDVSLSATQIPQNQFQMLSEHMVFACVGTPNISTTKGWTLLNRSIIPSQLRSLLNYSERMTGQNFQKKSDSL